MMEESLMDIIERMEGLVPEYSYSDIENISSTDRAVKSFLSKQLRNAKDEMFHVVQTSYELHRDRLSEAAEDVWDDLSALLARIANSRECDPKGSAEHCEKCMKRVEKDMENIIRRDRELVLKADEMNRELLRLKKMLFERGREKQFIKNLDKIKTYIDEMHDLIEQREHSILG